MFLDSYSKISIICGFPIHFDFDVINMFFFFSFTDIPFLAFITLQ